MGLLIHALALCFLTLGQASELPDAPASDPPQEPVSNLPEQPVTEPETPAAEPETPATEPETPAAEPEKPSEPQPAPEIEVPRPDLLTDDDQARYQRVRDWVRKYLTPDESRFTVYTREDYDKATALRVVSREFPFFLGELNAKDQCAVDSEGCTHREFDNAKESGELLNLRKITVSPVRTWGADQYIYLHFSDGAKIWYKQPRYGRLNRSRADVWIKGKQYLGIFGDNGHYIPERRDEDGDEEPSWVRYHDYANEVLITRPRNQSDPEKSNALEYTNRLRFRKDFAYNTAMVLLMMGILATSGG